mgnify:CR=1 FL=1
MIKILNYLVIKKYIKYLLLLMNIFIILITICIIVLYIKKKENFNSIKITPYTDNIKNRILFILWIDGELTQNRKDAINSIIKTTECNVILITKKNLNNYILKDYPLHKGFKYLSIIHKSDYLRCYLMHHYGGGYSDLKQAKSSWLSSYKKIKNNKNIWAVGLKGPENFGIAYPEEFNREQRNELKQNHKNLIGVGYFIYKPRTPLTYEWYDNLNKRMDYYYEDLKKYPAKYTRESYDRPPKKWCKDETNPELLKLKCPKERTKYPISWNRILGQINYPLQLKYLKYIEYGIPKPDTSKPYI